MAVGPLSYAQLEGLWLKTAAGTQYATKTWAALMAAIAEAESGGNPGDVNAVDNNGKQSSFGLWQISTGTHAPPSPNWADPATNAALALQKLQGQGLTAWGTYSSGAYKAYLNGSTTPDPDTPGNPAALDAESSVGQNADCLYGLPGIPGTSFLNDVLGGGGNVGNICIITRSEARGAAGVGLMLVGARIALTGLALAGAYAGAQTSTGKQLLGAGVAAAKTAVLALPCCTRRRSSCCAPSSGLSGSRWAGWCSACEPCGRSAAAGTPRTPSSARWSTGSPRSWPTRTRTTGASRRGPRR